VLFLDKIVEVDDKMTEICVGGELMAICDEKMVVMKGN
jgi:hypothetical protein